MGIVMWILSLFAGLFEDDEVLPAGLLVVETEGIHGYRRHIGRVRVLRSGLIEVREEPDTTGPGELASPRLYSQSAVRLIRPMTENEKKKLDEDRRFLARPCAHCGKLECPRKGLAAEYLHVMVPWARETWCERAALSLPKGTWIPPWEALTSPSTITCTECRAEIDSWEERFPDSYNAVSTRLLAGLARAGFSLDVPQHRTENIDKAAVKMKRAGAVFDDPGIDLLVHGDSSHVREVYGRFDGFEELAALVQKTSGIEWRVAEVA